MEGLGRAARWAGFSICVHFPFGMLLLTMDDKDTLPLLQHCQQVVFKLPAFQPRKREVIEVKQKNGRTTPLDRAAALCQHGRSAFRHCRRLPCIAGRRSSW
eukprot:5472302-Prymnesium_polylepis.2